MLVGRQAVAVHDDARSLFQAPVEHVKRLQVADRQDLAIAEVASDARVHGVDVPLLQGVAPRVGRGGGISPRDGQQLPVVLVGDGVRAVHHGLHVLAPCDVHHLFGVCLPVLVTCAAGQLHDIFPLRAVPVKEHVALFREEPVSGRGGLAFGRAAEGLHLAVRCAIDRGCRPVGAVFGVGQPFAVGGFAELAAGQFRRSPPDARLQAVFQSHHGFHHVVHLVGRGMFAVGPHGGVEIREAVEAAGQLVGVAFVDVTGQGVVPRQGFVAVDRVAATDAHAVESRVFAQQGGDLPEALLAGFAVVVLVSGQPLVPAVVRFVERGDGHHFIARFLEIAGGHVNKLCPSLGVFPVGGIHRGMVAVESQPDVLVAETKQPEPFREVVFLRLLQVAVHERIGRLERHAGHCHVVFPHEEDAAAQVLFVHPRQVGTPFHFVPHAFVRKPERDDAVGHGLCREVVARAGILPVGG